MEANLQNVLITHDDLESQLRQKGIDDFSMVARCLLEGDGHISVITNPATNQSQQTPAGSKAT